MSSSYAVSPPGPRPPGIRVLTTLRTSCLRDHTLSSDKVSMPQGEPARA